MRELMSKITKAKRVGGMVQVVKSLPRNLEALSSTLVTPKINILNQNILPPFFLIPS
jgi:hypothetical protein